MRCLPSISSLFLNELNKFNNTGARMSDSYYHVALELLKNRIVWLENMILPLLRNVQVDVITQRYLICKPVVVYQFNFITSSEFNCI